MTLLKFRFYFTIIVMEFNSLITIYVHAEYKWAFGFTRKFRAASRPRNSKSNFQAATWTSTNDENPTKQETNFNDPAPQPPLVGLCKFVSFEIRINRALSDMSPANSFIVI